MKINAIYHRQRFRTSTPLGPSGPPVTRDPPHTPGPAQEELAGLVNRCAARWRRFRFCFASLPVRLASLSLRFTSLFESNQIELKTPHTDGSADIYRYSPRVQSEESISIYRCNHLPIIKSHPYIDPYVCGRNTRSGASFLSTNMFAPPGPFPYGLPNGSVGDVEGGAPPERSEEPTFGNSEMDWFPSPPQNPGKAGGLGSRAF